MVGRHKEKESLLCAAERPEAQFVAVYGRRRVGKTYLIRETFHDDFCFCHVGVSGVGTAEQLLNFRDSLVKYGYEHCPSLKSWREAFLALEKVIERCARKRKVVFIDELPWMDTRRSKFVPALEHFWNGYASTRKDVLLIVCGSATSWMMNKLIKNHGGLHNRVTDRIYLKPFCLAECEEYAKELGLSYSREEIALGYMIFGGVPFYWSLMVRGLSLRQNVDALVFAETGKLRGEFAELFASLFKDGTMYRNIVTALSSVKSGMTREELVRKLKLADGGKVSKCLSDLETSGFVRKYVAFGKKKKNAVFQLIDNFSLFHLRYLSDDSNADENFWQNTAGSSMQASWAGLAFERLCLQHLWQLKNALQIGGVLTHVCSWRHAPDESYPKGAQIDIVIDRADGVIDVCEMKYTKDEFVPDEKTDIDMRRKMSVFSSVTGTRKSVNAVLVTPYGLLRNKYSGRFSNVITFDDLFVHGNS